MLQTKLKKILFLFQDFSIIQFSSQLRLGLLIGLHIIFDYLMAMKVLHQKYLSLNFTIKIWVNPVF